MVTFRRHLRTTSVADHAAATDRDAAIARAEADNASRIATAGERADQAALGAGGQEPEPEQRQRQRSCSIRIPSPAICSALAFDWTGRLRR